MAHNFGLKCIHTESCVSQGFNGSFDQGSYDDGHLPSPPRFLGKELQANVCQKSRQNFDQEVRCRNGELSGSSRLDVNRGQLWPGRAFEAVFGETRGGARTPAYPVRSPATGSHLRGKSGDCFLEAEGALSQEGSQGLMPRGGGEDSEAIPQSPACLTCSLEVPFLYLTLWPEPKNLSSKQGEGRLVSHVGLLP